MPTPSFHEDWYATADLVHIAKLIKRAPAGLLVELGAWEGKSTIALANACCPRVLHVVDTWQGNLAEGEQHDTVRLARSRDVRATFEANMRAGTQGNYEAHCQDCLEYLEALDEPVAFCHVDAAHDYDSVKTTLALLLPRLVPGVILCGHDATHPPVRQAVEEQCPGYQTRGNVWWVG